MASKVPQRKLLSPSTATSGSENRNPNVIHGSCKRKINNCPKSSATGPCLESNGSLKHLTGEVCSEFNLVSPPRKHVCSSRRCASKNPDYAVPATVNPRKFLVSKKHDLPRKEATMCKCSIRKSMGEGGAADHQLSCMEVCSSCWEESQKRRWSSDDLLTSSERHVKEALHDPGSGQIEQASINEAVPLLASETAHQECSTDTPEYWNRHNDSSNLQANQVDAQDQNLNVVSNVSEDSTLSTALSGSCGSESKHGTSYSDQCKLQVSPLPACDGLYCFGASSTAEQSPLVTLDDENTDLMPENEEEISPSPEKSGNWRLKAVLESFGNLSPAREGRVKMLVRAFESLLSVTGHKVEQQTRKTGGGPLKFSYLRSNADVEGEENTQRENFTYGGEGENEDEDFTYEEDRVAQWQTNQLNEDIKDEEIGDPWQGSHALPVYYHSVVKGKECLQDQEVEKKCAESHKEAVNHEEEDGREMPLQQQGTQEFDAQSVLGGMGGQLQVSFVVDDEKHGMSKQGQAEQESSLQEGVNNEEAQEVNARPIEDKDGMHKRWQPSDERNDEKCGMGRQQQEHEAKRESAGSLKEEVGEMDRMANLSQEQREEDKGKKLEEPKEEDEGKKLKEPNKHQYEEVYSWAFDKGKQPIDPEEHLAEVYSQTFEKGHETDKEDHKVKRESADSLQEEVGEMDQMANLSLSQEQREEDGKKLKEAKEPNKHQDEEVYAQALNKEKQPIAPEEHLAEVYSQTFEKVHETDKGEQQSVMINVSTRTLLFEGIVGHAPAFSRNPSEAGFERQLPNQKIRANVQHHSSQKFMDGIFASTAGRKKPSSRICESRRSSNLSISSTRPPLAQKSQAQSAPDKPHVSKPQPFKLLTEERGRMKEQEFMIRLRKILEEEEKLRVPLAQGLPWTTDEPEIPYKPPVKENTKPLDIHLNSEIRAMERADFDRFITEKLLYIEERRLEEERRRRAAEEEEIKRLRQEMVPKAQLMPYFDRPFRPRRSSKRPTIPKEPQFLHNKQQPKRQKCVANST